MKPRIEYLTEKKLIGKHMDMSFIENKTFQLWNSFMPKRRYIRNFTNSNLYSLEVFPEGYFDDFDPNDIFQKWAAVEVHNFEHIPSEMETLIIPSGLYAVFLHLGPQTEAHKTYHSIFVEWLPNSEYTVDNRPHFAVMDEKYKKDDPDSEEEIWIPIKIKAKIMMIETLKSLFNRDLNKLKFEIESYQNEIQIWKIDKEVSNSAGNLCLHLIGNINTYIGAEIGKTGYIRNRELEFSLKDIPKSELIHKIEETILVVNNALDILTESDLQAIYPLIVFEKEMKTGFFLVHLSTHLAYHLGQINYHRRLLS